MSTQTQDPIDHFPLITERVRRIGATLGAGWSIEAMMHRMLCRLFLTMLRAMSRILDRAGTDPLPEPAPLPQAPAPTRAPDPRPHHNGRPQPRIREAAWCGDQPALTQPIAEPPQVDRIMRPLARLHAADPPRELSCQSTNPRRRPRARSLWTTACRPRCRGPSDPLHNASRVFQARFEKPGLSVAGLLRPFRYGIATNMQKIPADRPPVKRPDQASIQARSSKSAHFPTSR